MKTEPLHSFDVIVIGAGHNGLTLAGLVAKSGKSVLVVEQRDKTGGLAVGDEFHLGHTASGFLCETSRIRADAAEALKLKRYGLSLLPQRADVLFLGGEEKALPLYGDPSKAASEISAFSARDARAYIQFRSHMEKIAKALKSLFKTALPNVDEPSVRDFFNLAAAGISLKRMGDKTMMDTLRVLPMCLMDCLNEWFETDFLKAGMCVPALRATLSGPWSPGSNANLVLWETGAQVRAKGGAAALIRSLKKAATAYGAKIMTNAKVARILVNNYRAIGVELADGSKIRCRQVAAACDARHALLDLVDPRWLGARFSKHVENIRGKGTTAQVNLAVRGPAALSARSGQAFEHAVIARDFTHLEKSL